MAKVKPTKAAMTQIVDFFMSTKLSRLQKAAAVVCLNFKKRDEKLTFHSTCT